MIYNLGDLKKAYEAGETFKFLFFWGHTPAAAISTRPVSASGGSALSRWRAWSTAVRSSL